MSGLFATLRAVKHDPERKIVAEIFEAMHHTGRHEQHIAGLKGHARRTVQKDAGTARYDIDLVLIVRLLGINAARRIDAVPAR